MSTSAGNPSNKVGWYKSLCAKTANENRLLELAKKGQRPAKMSKKTEKQFKKAQELAMELRNKEEVKKQPKKEETKV